MGIKFRLANTEEEVHEALYGKVGLSTEPCEGGGCELDIHEVEGDSRNLDDRADQEPYDYIKLLRLIIKNGLKIHPSDRQVVVGTIFAKRSEIVNICNELYASQGFINGEWHEFDQSSED